MNDDDAGSEALDAIDLDVWCVPPPVAVDAASLVARALSPVVAPPRRARLGWLVAAIVVVNAAIAVLLVIALERPRGPERAVVVAPAGGGSADASVRELLARLEQEQRDLERRLDELQQLRATVVELSDKLRRYEQHDHKTAPKPPDQPPVVRDVDGCDEVSCVLDENAGACCAKFRRPVPEALDRAMISNAMAAVRARVMECASGSPDHGTVKVHVEVGTAGVVTNTSVESAPSAVLGACVEAAVARATFPHTQDGGSFVYPFVL